jgi:hypothetical protein
MAIFVRLLMVFVGGGIGATLVANALFGAANRMSDGPSSGEQLIGMGIGAFIGFIVASFIVPSNTTPPEA